MRSIALLVDDKEFKRRLKRLLSPSYKLMRGRSSAHIPKRPFDLAIVDIPALERLKDQLEACKDSRYPIALPVVLVVAPQDLESERFQAVKNCIDEIIPSPIRARALEVRLGAVYQAIENTIQIERSLHALSQTSLAGVIIIQGRHIAFANESLAKMCGYSLDEFLNLTAQEVRRMVYPEDRRGTLKQMHEIYRGHAASLPTQFRFRQKDGSIRWMEMLVNRITYRGQPALQGTAIDINERKEALDAVRQRELALQKAQAVSHVGSWVWDIQTNHLEWSDEMYRIFGIQEEKFSGDLADVIQEAIHPEDREAVNRSNQSVIEDKKPLPLEYRVVWPDGSIRTVWAEAGELILDENGNPAKLSGIVQDITDRKRFEGALQESQERLTSLYNSMQEAFTVQELVYDSSGRSVDYVILDVNPRFEEVMGLERDKVIGRLATDVYQVERAPYLGRYSKVVLTGKPTQFEAYYEPTDRHFQISAFRPAKDQFATVFTDYSERKRMEEELRESRRRLKTLMDNLPGMAYRCQNDPDRSMEIVSLGCLALTGYSPDELLIDGRIGYGELLHPDDRQMVWDEVRIALQAQRVFQLVYRIKTAENQQKWVWEQGQGVFDRKGQVLALEGFIIDISDRMMAEEAMRQSEERYRRLAETTPDVIIVHNPGGRITYINQAGCDYIGYEREEIYTRKTTEFIASEYEHQIAERRAKRMRGDLKTFRYEAELVNRDGKRVPVDVRSTPIIQEGEVRGILVVARDMSERKQAEEALRKSQDLLNKSQAIAQVGSWELDLTLDRLTWSDEVYRMFGLNPDDFEANYDAFMASVHPSDREAVDQAYRQSLEEGGDPYEIEHRIIRQDTGDVRIVLEKCDHIKDETGKVVRSVGMVQDITQRKSAQQAIEDSERKFREVVAQATDGIVMTDSDGLIIEWNARQAEITGIEPAQAIGTPVWEIQGQLAIPGEIPPEVEANREEYVRRVIQSPQSEYYGMNFIRRIKRGDGTVRIIETALYPIHYGDDLMVVSVFRDITERKEAEEERDRLTDQIRDQALEMEHILAAVPTGVVLLDANGIIQQANPVAEEDLVALADARVGGRLTRLGRSPLNEILSSPPVGLWHEIPSHNKVYEVIAKPMETSGEDGYWVLVINNVTRDREIRKQLQQQGQLAAVGQLAAGIAHDFNNIIAIIGLYAELGLSTPELDRKIAERFEMIEQQADRAAHLTQQIMDFSRSSVLQRQPMDLGEFFNEFGQLIQQTLPQDIQIEVHNQAEGCTVTADPTRLQQALLNLVLNSSDAVKAKEGGIIRLTLTQMDPSIPIQCITCGQISSGDWIRIQVKDDGSGIEPDVIAHIFEPFFTTKDVGQGTGLGLAQVYGIVKQHDGHINVDSELGLGTTFTIFLPISNVDPVVLESYEGTGRVFGRGEKILVVEDNPVLRDALRETLELLNYQILEAENGKKALEMLDSDKDIALVLSDLVMPVMGGQAMFQEIKQRRLSVPVIMLSGHPMKSESARLKLEGLAGWLLKPPTTDHLAHLVASVIKQSSGKA